MATPQTQPEVSRQVALRRLGAQLLVPPRTGTPETVTRHLLAVQSQDLRGARLAVRARTEGLGSSDVDRALAQRNLVVTWVNRGTLHLVSPHDLPLLHALTTPQLAVGNARRLAQEGVPPDDAERAVAAVRDALSDRGPLTRSDLKEVVDRLGVRTEGQALIHTLFLATLRGWIIRGPMAGKDQAFVLVRDWLGADVEAELTGGPADRPGALAELARRYLVGHGPATDRDLAKWAGTTLGDARAGLSAIASELEEVGGPGQPDGLVDLAPGRGGATSRRAGGGSVPPPRLLGAFDALLMGWVSRVPVLGENTSVVTSNGVFRPFVLVDGRAVGTWRLQGSGTKAAVEITPFDHDVDRAAVRREADALADDAADVVRFLAS